MDKKGSYNGKNVFVGIDVHKATYSVCVICESEVVGKTTMPANAQALIGYLRRFEGAVIASAYEAGYFGFSLHRSLIEQGIANIVVNAGSIEVAVHDRVKTDKRDAKKLAVLLAGGRLKGIRIPTVEEEQHRLLTRTREQLSREKRRLSNQIWAKIAFVGLDIPDRPKHLSKRFLKRLLSVPMATEVCTALKALVSVWENLRQEIRDLDKQLAEQAKGDEAKERIYRSAPGIGPLAARTLANELGDMLQFKNERALFSFTGLTPSEHSSGDKTVRGHITHQGASRLRNVLVEGTWKAIVRDKSLRDTYMNIAARRGKQRAIVATARHLVGRLRACFRKGETWNSGLQVALA